MSERASTSHDPYAAFRISGYRRYLTGNVISLIGLQMFNVAVGWELYQLTDSATALGLLGFFYMLPMLFLAVPAGHLIDRVDRKKLIIIDQLLLTVAVALLASADLMHNYIPAYSWLDAANRALTRISLFFGDRTPRFEQRHIPIIYFMIVVSGAIRSLTQPAKQAILPQLVPPAVFTNAVTWHSSMFEISTVLGPTIGGALLGTILHYYPQSTVAFSAIYFLTALTQFVPALVLIPVRLTPLPRSKEPFGLDSLLAGFRYVWRTKVIFAAITLDMFAVLLGGATALLPMIAKEILHVGPLELGILRSAPSLGAIAMAVTLAHRPPMRRGGRNLLIAVVGFGVATIGFGLSQNYFLSLGMLFLTGMFDNVSVVVRHTLVQVLTPNEMRGRVSAVNSIFISCSNELGALESGLTAAWFGSLLGTAAAGAACSVIVGGIGTILVAAVVGVQFPILKRIGALQDVKAGFGRAEEEDEKVV